MSHSLKYAWSLALHPFHWITVIMVVFLDQASKYWIIWKLDIGERIPILPVFDITHIKNKGAAFGMFHDTSPAFRLVFFGLVTIICLILLLYWLGTTPIAEKWQRFGLSLILGGALGNLKDRIVFGQVTDFIHVFYKSWSYPAFNIADSAITIGVAIILIRMLAHQMKAKKIVS